MFAKDDAPILAGRVRNGFLGARRIDVAVRAMSRAVRIGFLLEIGTVFLRVCCAELPVAGQIALLAQDGRRARILMVLLAGRHRDDTEQCNDELHV